MGSSKATSTRASLAKLTMVASLTTILAASSKLSQAKILNWLWAISALASSTCVPENRSLRTTRMIKILYAVWTTLILFRLVWKSIVQWIYCPLSAKFVVKTCLQSTLPHTVRFVWEPKIHPNFLYDFNRIKNFSYFNRLLILF